MKRRYLVLAPLLGAAVWMTTQNAAVPVSPLAQFPLAERRGEPSGDCRAQHRQTADDGRARRRSMKRRYLMLAPLPQFPPGAMLTPARWRSAEASRPVIAESNIVKPRLTAAEGGAR